MYQFALKGAKIPQTSSDSFDTKAGITSYLTDLAGLNRLIKDRRRAGYEDRKRLREWVVLGRYHCDTCGNFATIINDRKGDFIPSLVERGKKEPVFASQDAERQEGEWWCMASGTEPPSAKVRCWYCRERWHLENCHDSIRVDCRNDVWEPEGFHRLTLGEYADHIAQMDDAERWVSFYNSNVRNDKYIDLTPEPDFPTLKKNERGWVKKPREHVLEFGDEVMIETVRLYHPFCRILDLRKSERDLIRGIFNKAGYQGIEMMTIPNEYCSKPDCCGPWFLVETSIGTIKIGWRKRVFNIDWSRTGQDFLPLFEKEDVTKWNGGIHAWGEKKAEEYLRRMRTS